MVSTHQMTFEASERAKLNLKQVWSNLIAIKKQNDRLRKIYR